MNNVTRQTDQARKSDGPVKIGDDRHRTGRSQFVASRLLARHGEYAKTTTHQRQQAHADIAATKDQ